MNPTLETETLAKLTELLRQATQTQPAAPSGFPQTQAAFAIPTTQPTGILIPIRVETPLGEVGCYVSLPAGAIQNLAGTITQLQAAGFPIRHYQPRASVADSGNGWQQSRRSWGRRTW